MSAHSNSEAERAQLEKAVEAGKQQCREAFERLSEAERVQLEKIIEAGKQQAREAFERFKVEQPAEYERGKAELAAKLQAEVERQRPKPEKLRHDGKPA